MFPGDSPCDNIPCPSAQCPADKVSKKSHLTIDSRLRTEELVFWEKPWVLVPGGSDSSRQLHQAGRQTECPLLDVTHKRLEDYLHLGPTPRVGETGMPTCIGRNGAPWSPMALSEVPLRINKWQDQDLSLDCWTPKPILCNKVLVIPGDLSVFPFLSLLPPSLSFSFLLILSSSLLFSVILTFKVLSQRHKHFRRLTFRYVVSV